MIDHFVWGRGGYNSYYWSSREGGGEGSTRKKKDRELTVLTF